MIARVRFGVSVFFFVALLSNCGEPRKPPCVYDAHGEMNWPCEVTAETVRQEKALNEKKKRMMAEQMRKFHRAVSEDFKKLENGPPDKQPKGEKAK